MMSSMNYIMMLTMDYYDVTMNYYDINYELL